MDFQCINIRQVPWQMFKTSASGLGFQQVPRDLVSVNARKNMYDPCINILEKLCHQLKTNFPFWYL